MKTMITSLALFLVACGPAPDEEPEPRMRRAEAPVRFAEAPDAGAPLEEEDAGQGDAGEPEPECLEHDECPGASSCVAGRCSSSCAKAEACDPNTVCLDVFDDVGEACAADDECPVDVCEGGDEDTLGRCSLSGQPCNHPHECVPPMCDAETGRCRYRRACVEVGP